MKPVLIRRRLASRLFSLSCLLALLVGSSSLFAAPWLPFGPNGGDARRFAADPQSPAHIFLGTANGWLYESVDSGANWHRLSRPGKRDDLVLDGIFVDPTNSKHLIVGAWAVGSRDGGVFLSNDGGINWINQAEMRGQSVLALTAAPSDPKTLVAGTLRGVYRSTDGGVRWNLISPPDSTEIHDVQSVAIDPKDPSIIYAGTWHLPWKTTDGGANWANIKQGIIEDSDVFSIIVDPDSPTTVYASACSGIYKSEDAGEQFRKVQGIPSSARRTRVLLQDPHHLSTVYAGTTEGLFRSEDSGKEWSRTTDASVIVNDVFIDQRDSKHVLIATDRGGIFASEDGGDTFHSSNGGFSARQITDLQRDNGDPSRLYVGVVNDKEYGGVFESDNGGIDWVQKSSGFEGRDIFALGQAPDGTILAGTGHGLFRLDRDASVWIQINNLPPARLAVVMVPVRPVRAPVFVARNSFSQRTGLPTSSQQSPGARLRSAQKGVHARSVSPARAGSKRIQTRHADKMPPRSVRGGTKPAQVHTASRAQGSSPTASAQYAERAEGATPVDRKEAATPYDGGVYDLATADQVLLAATSSGLMASSDNGETWAFSGPERSSEWRFLAAAKHNAVAATLKTIDFSSDSGASWFPVAPPPQLTQISAVAVEPSGEIWAGGREGVFASSDGGNTWTTPKNLFVTSVTSLFYDDRTNRVLVSSSGAHDVVFMVQLPGKTVTYADAGWNLRFVRPVGDHLVGATFFDGIVIQPSMVAPPAHEGASR
jgi:photosystem II stability/assembly factor-like uncharacterized protein